MPESSRTRIVIFTDLDGTLIDHHTYSYDDALDTLDRLKKMQIPVVVCTSKTRKEIEKFREKLGINHPFISENGGAIYIPQDYFSFDFPFDRETAKYKIIELGTGIDKLKDVLVKIKQEGCMIRGFSDMSAEELSEDSGLKVEDAAGAKSREYDEAFKILEADDEHKVLEMIKASGYNHTKGGRYYHIMGNNDKGKAVLMLAKLFERRYEGFSMRTVGLGDGLNDVPMLRNVDVPIIVRNSAHTEVNVNFKVIRTEDEGPKGWSCEIEKIISD